MRVNVAQLLKESIGSSRSATVDEVIDLDVTGDGGGGKVHGDVELTRINRGIIAMGKLDTSVNICCSRCLSEYECLLHMEIEEEFYPLTDIFTGAPLSLPEDHDVFTIDNQHILDMTEAIRQSIVLAFPMKPLCREDCAGLCPQCGQNLNEKVCGCQTEKIDPRLEKLLSAKVRLKDQEGK